MPSVSSLAGTDSSAIEVIIVGCGFAGLACAIESRRRGHKVILLEKRPTLESLGDVISFAPNTGRLFERWGLGEQLMSICTQHPVMHMHDHTGELLAVQPLPQKLYGSNSYNGRRGEIHEILLKYAKKLGADVRFSQNVEAYWEDPEKKRAGVVVNGERMEADVVVGADGARSRARELVFGYEDKPIPSGYAIYRAWFNSKEQGLDTDPLTSMFYKEGGEFHAWIGKDIHMLAMSFRDGEEMCWVLTHKDDNDINESWSYPGKIEDVLSYVDGWDPCARALIEKAPFCVDWKLVQRDPLPTWVSEGGRTVVIGDAAHPFLPTSIQGASQGVEDGVTLAITLALSGKKNVPLATRTFEHIRYDRVCRAQAQGESTRNKLHKDPEAREEEDVAVPFPEWLLNFDAEKHAGDVYGEISQGILLGGYVRPSVQVAHEDSSECTSEE
ncbi:hypothetical protein M0805_005656 [Coniferiporia weirii]|nr:hypothetical protein M0805_005656 [Coniferiporia weirii]